MPRSACALCHAQEDLCHVLSRKVPNVAGLLCVAQEGLCTVLSCIHPTQVACVMHNGFFFVSELMDLLLTGEDQSQANQPNNLAEGHPM